MISLVSEIKWKIWVQSKAIINGEKKKLIQKRFDYRENLLEKKLKPQFAWRFFAAFFSIRGKAIL